MIFTLWISLYLLRTVYIMNVGQDAGMRTLLYGPTSQATCYVSGYSNTTFEGVLPEVNSVLYMDRNPNQNASIPTETKNHYCSNILRTCLIIEWNGRTLFINGTVSRTEP